MPEWISALLILLGYCAGMYLIALLITSINRRNDDTDGMA